LAVNIDVQIGADGPVVFTPSADWFGKETITFFANDSEYEVSDKLDVKVISVNDPPVIESVGDRVVGRDTLDFVIYEKEWSNISILCSDVDGNRLTLSTDPFDPFPGVESRDYYVLTMGAMAFELSLRPNNGMIGTYTINLTVKDSGGGKDHADVGLTIVNVNDPPDTPVILSPPQGAALNATDPLVLIGTCDDPDLHIPGSDEVLSFSWSSNMSGEIGTGAELTGQTLPPGVHMITLTVSDGELTRESHVGESDAFCVIWVIVAILAVLALAAVLLVMRRRRKAREEEEAEQAEEDEGRGAGMEGAEGLRIQLPMAVPPPFAGAAAAAPFPVAQLPQPPQVSGYLPPAAPTPATAAPSPTPAAPSSAPSTVMPGAVATATAAPAGYQASLPLASPSAGPAAFAITPNPYSGGQSPPTAVGYTPQQTGFVQQQVGPTPQQVGLTPQQIGVAPHYPSQSTARSPLLLSNNTGSV
jgi:type II secretory pathway pseudopilin PulG